jgi:outer membrane protein assembly factor BamD (BamD/ComL family)
VNRDLDEQTEVDAGVRFSDDSPEERLRAAGRAATDGDYVSAIRIYSELERNEAAPPEIRETALYRLAMAYGNPLNSRRDYEKAARNLTRLLGEYPETRYRQDAETALAKYQEILNPD